MKSPCLTLLVLTLAACGAPDRPPGPEANVIGDPLQQSLDKARSVEDLNAERKDGLDAAVDEAN